MRVCQLKLNQFRNYHELDLRPNPGLNILHGANAQGKTNILEALWLLATTRSLRASRESELICKDAEMAHVTAEIDREREGDVELQVSVFQGDNKKAVRVNGMKRDRIIDLLGQFNVVFFGALDLSIVTGEPTDRRHYLNMEISQISPRYVINLGHYKRVLQQRNRLLKDLRDRPRPPAEMGLDVWTEQLVQFGAPLLETRRFYVERLMPLAAQIHRELTDDRETLEIRYLPSFPLPSPISLPTASGSVRESSAEERYLAQVANETTRLNGNGNGTRFQPDVQSEIRSEIRSEIQSRTQSEIQPEVRSKGETRIDGESSSFPDSSTVSTNRESHVDSYASANTQNRPESPLSATERVANAFRAALSAVGLEEARRGTTLVGPQRDDLSFYINGADARIYGSQGQQRTVALSLKLAEFRLVEEYVGEAPVILLDDVMSDLDDSRRQHLLDWIRGRGQTFITCTNLRSFPEEILAEATTFHITAGTLTPDRK